MKFLGRVSPRRQGFPVKLSIDSAVGLLSNLETAQQERSMLLLDEQNLLEKEEKEGCV